MYYYGTINARKFAKGQIKHIISIKNILLSPTSFKVKNTEPKPEKYI